MFRFSPPVGAVRSALLASAAVLVSPLDAEAQSARTSLPPVTVTAPEQQRVSRARPPRNTAQSPRSVRQARNPATPPEASGDQGRACAARWP